MTDMQNENTYNPSCPHFDTYLGVCGYPDNGLKACRKFNCPKEEYHTELIKKTDLQTLLNAFIDAANSKMCNTSDDSTRNFQAGKKAAFQAVKQVLDEMEVIEIRD